MNEEEFNTNNQVMTTDCPVCGQKNSLEVTNKTDNIPYFGDILETSVSCNKCGYQSSDNICLEKRDPVKYTLSINNEKLNTRVARSQTATVSIPEVGVKVEPGSKSEGYVSNVEGILNRFEEVVLRALKLMNPEELTDEVQDNAMDIISQLNYIKMGELTATLIIEDPFGHSVVDDDDAIKEDLTEEEISKLQTGFTTI